MLGLLIAAALASGIMAYFVGYAFIAPRESFFRTKAGGIILAVLVLGSLSLPFGIEIAASSGSEPSWPTGLDPDVYRFSWIALMATGLFSGLRVWRMRPLSKGFGFDESHSGRAESQLPLADSLEGALDVLSREKLGSRDIARLAPALRRVGQRFSYQMPAKDGEVYDLVAQHVPRAVAAEVTGLLLEGASRKESGRSPTR